MPEAESSSAPSSPAPSSPAPIRLRTGPLSASFAEGQLLDVRLDDTLILDRVQVTVRDPDWNTVAIRLDDPCISFDDSVPDHQAFMLTSSGQTTSSAVDLSYQLILRGEDGHLQLELTAVPQQEFLANRVGLVLLHPQQLAGSPAVIKTSDPNSDSPATAGSPAGFPTEIDPQPVFTDLTELRHRVAPDSWVAFAFAGALFETEDQRNWTDASYKTYCTPLHRPRPARFTPDTVVRQGVMVSACGPPRTTGHDQTAAARRSPGQDAAAVHIAGRSLISLPSLGFGSSTSGGPLDADERDQVQLLRPDQLMVELDSATDWSQRLTEAAQNASDVGTALELSLVSHDHGRDLEPLLNAIAATDVAIRRIHSYDAGTSTTGPSLAAQVRVAATSAGLAMPLGGGSRAHFAELNRATLPLDQLDFVSYAVTPQVHAFDDESIMSTTLAQPQTVRQARRIAPSKPLIVGPVTLLPRFNAVASDPQAEMAVPADPRHPTWFTASWTVATLAALAEADTVTFFQTVGPGGLLPHNELARHADRTGQGRTSVFPVHTVFAALNGFRDGDLLRTTATGAVGVLALQSGSRIRILLANRSAESITAAVTTDSIRLIRAVRLEDGSQLDPHRPEIGGHGVTLLDGGTEFSATKG